MAKLTAKQKRFVEEYLVDLNATQAAIRAGYKTHTAKQIGSENLSKPYIKSAIEKEIAKLSARTGVNQERIIRELAKIAFVNPVDVMNMTDAMVRGDAGRDDTSSIQSVKIKTIPTEEGNITEREVKLYDKKGALELLGKHLGMFTDKLNVTGELGVKIIDNIPKENKE